MSGSFLPPSQGPGMSGLPHRSEPTGGQDSVSSQGPNPPPASSGQGSGSALRVSIRYRQVWSVMTEGDTQQLLGRRGEGLRSVVREKVMHADAVVTMRECVRSASKESQLFPLSFE